MAKKTKAPADLAGQLKEAIAASGLTHYAIGKAARVSPDNVLRFVDGRDIRISTAGKLAAALGLHLAAK